MGQGGTDQAHGAKQRALDGLFPAGLIELIEAAGWRPARIDEHGIESAERLDRTLDCRCRSIDAREVDADPDPALHRSGGRLEALGRSGDQHDPSTFAGQCGADREAQPARSAADQDARAVQTRSKERSSSWDAMVRDGDALTGRREGTCRRRG